MATPLILDYAPRKEFEPFHERRESFACIVTHRRAGKTVACVQELQRAAMQSRNVRPRFAYLAPFQKQAKAVAWDYLRAAMASVRPRHLGSRDRSRGHGSPCAPNRPQLCFLRCARRSDLHDPFGANEAQLA